MDVAGVRRQTLKRVAATIAEHSMLADDARVLVAFSGGADSTALAISMIDAGYDVVLAHVDHGMRPGSEEDVAHCAKVAERLGAGFVWRRVTVVPPTEAAARDARYAALREMAAESGSDVIATGHTYDDDAETVALRLERGGFGLGIWPVRGDIVRPLIDVRRTETEQVCREAGIDFLMDPTNTDMAYSRNRVRARLRDAGDDEVHLLADLGRANMQAASAGRAAAHEIVSLAEIGPDITLLPDEPLLSAPAGVAAQAIRLATARWHVEPTGAVVEDVLAKVVGRTGSRLQVAPALWAWSEPGALGIGPDPLGAAGPAVVLEMGVNRLAGWDLEVGLAECEPAPVRDHPYTAVIDGDAVTLPLTLRSPEAGDRFHPLGAPGTKKLQDYFVDRKVPRRLRRRVPVITSASGIVWVVGMQIDDGFRLTDRSARGLKIAVRSLTPTERGG